MAILYPASLDSLVNPTATSAMTSPSHADQHADANDAIEALQAKVGTTSSAVVTSLDYVVRNLPAANIASGTLPSARMSGSYTGITGVGTLSAGSIPTSLITGLAASATTDTTSATNIGSGTLNNARLPIVATTITSVGTLTTLSIAGTFSRGVPVTKTASFTLADTENWVICNGTASITVTLPAASAQSGRELTIKNLAAFTVVSATANIAPIGSATAGTAILPATVGAWVTLVSNGSVWVVMAT